jgi:uncharacterized membrane protein YqaE (UPF0057 family)
MFTFAVLNNTPMKKIVSSSIMFLAGAMMVTSAASAQGLTIQKRHYNKGFYIDFGKKKTDAKQTLIVGKDINTIEASANATIPIASANNEEMQMVTVNNVTVKPERSLSKHVAAVASKAVKQNVTTETNESTHNEVVRTDDSVTSAASVESSSNHAGVSLLLLVIITILIPPLGVALAKGIGIQFWIDLILTLLFYFPGLIYGLIVILSND